MTKEEIKIKIKEANKNIVKATVRYEEIWNHPKLQKDGGNRE